MVCKHAVVTPSQVLCGRKDPHVHSSERSSDSPRPPHFFQLIANFCKHEAEMSTSWSVTLGLWPLSSAERTVARHEVVEVELRRSEDGGGREADDSVIIYNRVPKTASTSFTNIAYDLCSRNRFHVLHINTTKNNPVMSLQDQVRACPLQLHCSRGNRRRDASNVQIRSSCRRRFYFHITIK
ncbi:hypothetical protein CCH79_00011070 [Gambusia affinis]|uniref:Heparan sulfate 2-O-sulfotransferase 1 n=1 Tax=Gambusia affinis TaxID=33528 RepID=A0A315UU74_GAMAF|nr:hypothetical protein CCH79_00011070 [Gambusia affinis]